MLEKFIFIIDNMQIASLRFALENNIPIIVINTERKGIND